MPDGPSACPQAITGFPPNADTTARLLILGSMPGERSLDAAQYYAHPRNSFWPILARIVGFDPLAPYDVRLKALRDAGIALWDVLQSCVRAGSLDAAIDSRSIQPNDFAGFFAAHPHIARVCFNGGTAERYFRTQVLPTLPALPIRYLRLPSTSPAHASLSFEQKLAGWQAAVGGIPATRSS